jgi:signal transduction histidine kinase
VVPPNASPRARAALLLAALGEVGLAALLFAVLIPVGPADVAVLRYIAPALYVPAAVIYVLVARWWLRPVRQLVAAAPPAGGDPDRALRSEARRALILHPRRTLLLRIALWTAIGVLLSPWLHFHTGFPLRAFASIAFALGIPAAIFGTFQAMWLRQVARDLLARFYPRIEPVRSYVEVLDEMLNMSAAAVGSLGVLFGAAFFHYFLDFTVERLRTMWKFFPYFVLALTTMTWVVVYWMTRRPKQFLRQLVDDDLAPRRGRAAPEDPFASGGEAGRPRFRTAPAAYAPAEIRLRHAAPLVHRIIQRLPYRIAALTFLNWSLAMASIVVHAANVWQLAPEDMGLIVVAGLIIASAVATYQIQWHRGLVRPALTTISTRIPLRFDKVAGTFGLRGKIVLSYGVVAAFAVAISLLASFVQLRRWSTQDVQSRAEDRARAVLTELHGAPISPAALLRLTPRADEWVFFRTDSEVAPVWAGGVAPAELAAFPLDAEVAFGVAAEGGGGPLDLRDLQLAGYWLRVDAPAGSLGVLLPGYRARGLGTRILTSLAFFVILLAASLGIVFLAAREITIPIETLSRQASAIEEGALDQPVPLGEGDQIGELAHALDRMREALRQYSAELEEKVRARTAELRETQSQLIHSEKMAFVGQAVAGVAHEINNLLNALANSIGPLDAAVQTLARAVDEGAARATADGAGGAGGAGAPGGAPDAATREARAEVGEMVRVLRNAVGRAQRIVTDLRNFSRPGETTRRPVDLREGITETLRLVGHLAREKNIRVETRLEDVGLVECAVGPLNQVFMNLVVNAIQAAETGSDPWIRITLEREEGGGGVLVRVEDNGPGIPREVRARIFEPFYTTKPAGKGTGLGLSISEKIVKQHDGTIEVASAPGRGATFTVRLPPQPAARA